MSEFPKTMSEDDRMENLHIVLHSKGDIPLFQGPADNRISLKKGEKLYDNFITEFRIPFSAKVTATDQSLRKYSIEKRKCRFENELGDMKLFKTYSYINCIFECKLEIVRKLCNCLPWYLELENQTEPVCNLFGNKCYEQITIRANQLLDFSNPFQPSCHCFPECEV